MNKEYKGISFPFRLNLKGGVSLSSTNPYDPKHIEEGLLQLLGSKKFERVMEANFGSTVGKYVLNYQDTALYNMIKYEVIKVVKEQEKRVVVDENATRVFGEDNSIIVELHYYIDMYEEKFISHLEI